MTQEHDNSKHRWIATGASLLAIGIHIYLAKVHYEINFGESAGSRLCDISASLSCSAASASRFSEFFGVPLALWGVLVNLGYVLLAAWESVASAEARPGHRSALLGLAGLAATASIVMGGISLFALKGLCPFCLATYVLSAVTAFGAYKAYYSPAHRWTFRSGPVILGGFLLVGGLIANDIFRSSYAGPGGNAMARAAQAEWLQNPSLEIAETDPLAMGPTRNQAKLVLIEFADFRCIHCKMAVEPVKAFMASHPDTRLEFYSWPLDGECNTSIQQNNGASCLLARIAWCARQGADKGWEAHHHLFDRFEEWKSAESIRAALPSIAAHLEISEESLTKCSESDEAKSAIKKHAELGSSLNLRGTPTVFANGKLLPAGTQIPVLNEVHRGL